MKNTYFISTVCNIEKHTQGEDIVAELKGLGFSGIELNFQFTGKKLKGVQHCVNEGLITVGSVHNYCPMPEGSASETTSPDEPSLAAKDENVRQKAVEYTKQTITSAVALGAQVMVLHGGRVEIEERTRALIKLYNLHGQHSKIFKKLFHEAIDDRNHTVSQHFDALATSLSELVPYARKHNIKLGLENRFYYRELPAPEEIKKLLHYFNEPTVGYWHDIGHAYVLEGLGLYRPFVFLGSFYKTMIGIHIHDIIQFNDHQVPFTGEFPWHELARYDMSRALKVLELHTMETRETLHRCIKRLDEEAFVR